MPKRYIHARSRKKKIVHALTYKENSWTWNSRICIAYCVRQQNGIAIINENIVGCPVLQNMIQCFPYASLIRYRYNGTAMAFCFLTFIITRKENSVCSCTAAKRGQREIGCASRSRDRVRAIEDWFLRRIQSVVNGRGKKYENVSRANRSATAAESARVSRANSAVVISFVYRPVPHSRSVYTDVDVILTVAAVGANN